jgi:putative endonuclease
VSTRRQAVGRWGEDVAAEYLKGLGYEVVDRNVRTPFGEIDLVVRRGEFLFFVEVKTRTNRSFGLPEDSVNLRKQSHMLAAAEHYAGEHGVDNWQLDVIAIEGHPGGHADILHLENVLSD